MDRRLEGWKGGWRVDEGKQVKVLEQGLAHRKQSIKCYLLMGWGRELRGRQCNG